MSAPSKIKEFKKPDLSEGQSFPWYQEPPVDNQKGYEGKRLEVTCVVGGNPFPKVSWKKGQWLQLDDGGRFEVKCDPETGKCLFAIKNCRMTDIGKYRVVSTNEFGELAHYFHIKVDQTLPDTQIGAFKSKLRTRKVKQSVKLSPEEKEKEILNLLKKSQPKHYERICLDNGFYDFRMILKKLKEMQKVEPVEPVCEAVHVMKKLRHVTVNDDGTAVFETHLENVDPGQEIKWYHNGEVLEFADSPDKRHEIRRVGNVHQLIIRNTVPEDAGNYTLEVGKERFDAVLTIKEKPLKFDVGLKDKNGKVHGRAVFNCAITQRGKKVTWFHDDVEIDIRHSNGRIEAVTEGKHHTLIVTELKMKDAGKYSVKVGDIESTANLTVTAPPIKFRQRLVNTEVAERGTAVFDCSINNKEVPAKWKVNGKLIKSNKKYTINKGDVHSLEIKEVELKDNNAKIEVSFGDVKSSAILHVNAKPIKIITKLTNVKCKIGEPAEFSTAINCQDEKMQFQWCRDDKPIDRKDPNYEFKQNRGRYMMRVKRAKVEDEGRYSFQLRGCHQEATLSCSSPPKVDISFLDLLRNRPMKAKAGEKLEIIVPLEGRAPMQATWMNGRTTLSNHGRFHIEIDNDKKVAKLVIDNCKASDSGLYELNISNDCGDLKVEIPVTITDKPEPPSGQVAVSDVHADSVKLSWNPPIDKDAQVDGYVIEVKDPKTGEWKPLAEVDKDQTEFVANGLTEGVPYQFRVMSKNDMGVSEPLESSTVTPLSPGQAPKVDQDVIDFLENNPIFVKAGETASIRIPCQGNPPPSVMWLHEDEEIIPVKHHRAKKLSTRTEVELQIKKCRISDSGLYEAKIFNNSGGLEVHATLVVLDVPDMSKGKIEFDKVTDKTVKFHWSKPESGSDVKSYIIERALKDNYELWEKVGETPGDVSSFLCEDCKEDTPYIFRVSAINDQGAGAPLKSSPVTCAAKEISPSVDKAVIAAFAKAPLKVKVGQTCRINIPMKGGNPPPTVTWEKNGKPVEDDGHRVVVDHSDHDAAHISVYRAEPDDAGRYVCRIKNAAGEVVVPVDVEILAPPAKVEGKIEFGDVTSKGVDLSWTPVKEDGGLPVTHYIVERKEVGRKVWANVGKTKDGATCKFHGTGIPGKQYQYRVKAVNDASEGEESAPSDVIVLKEPFDPPAAVSGEIGKIDSTDDSITISWEEVTEDHGSPIIGYVIEKRKKGSAVWVKCNEPEDCKRTEFKATKLQKGTEYEFRVMAVNGGGESDPSVPSRPFTATMSVAPPGEPSDLKLVDSTNTSMTLGWKEAALCGGADIIGYEIELKREMTDKWIPYTTSPVKGNQFTIKGLELGKAYQARIRTVNQGAHSRWYYLKSNLLAAETLIAPEFKMTSELEMAIRKGIQVNAGTTIRLHVPYHARPRPTIKWTRDDTDVDEALINDMEGISQLAIRGSRSWHTGSYTIALTNSSGTQKLTIKVVVIDSPSAPEGPLVVSDMNDSGLTLSWKPPKHDGGSKVKCYTIQKREARGRDWSTLTGKVKECKFTINELAKQRSFYFRVLAENEIGLGDPLQTKDMIFIKQKVEKVQIEDITRDEKDLRKPPSVSVPLKSRKVPDGVKVTLSCSIAGKPYPSIKWLKNGREVNDQHIFKENVIGLCRLVITQTKATDSGTYKVVAENEVGKTETSATLTITT